jgi:hypothetical protein
MDFPVLDRQKNRFSFFLFHLNLIHDLHPDLIKLLENRKRDKDSRKNWQFAKEFIKVEIDMLKACYEATKNPLFIWYAYIFCSEVKLRLPDWVDKYFYNAAVDLVNAGYQPPVGKRSKYILIDKLGFKARGQGNCFTRFANTFDNFDKYLEVENQKDETGLQYKIAESAVANKLYPDDEKAGVKLAGRLNELGIKLRKIHKKFKKEK